MRQALLLNAGYEPLCVVPLRRAVVLVLTERADIVSEADGEFRSPSVSIPVPAVIRLRRWVKVPYRGRLPLTRRHLLARDDHTCAYCGRAGDTIDHVIPRSRGGLHEWENVVVACRRCNSTKGDRLLSELAWALPCTPSAPHTTRWLLIGVADPHPAWEPFITGDLPLPAAASA